MNALEVLLLLAKPALLICEFFHWFNKSVIDLEESEENGEPRADWLSIFFWFILTLIVGIFIGLFAGMLQ